tara:strand:- start:3441 stop:4268 length:828 start_codon:yes stop_codon:yes gene_type:complete
MKIRHNKKRNSAFVYEALIREITVATLKKDFITRNKAINILKEYFKPSTLLFRDLDCYRALSPRQNLDQLTSLQILQEVKSNKKLIDADELFQEQTEIINTINKDLSPSVFSNFVPNYKSLATISQIFSMSVGAKNKVLLERQILNDMALAAEVVDETSVMDKNVYRLFTQKFNNKYESQLSGPQKKLLAHYVTSFADNALSLKMFLNEEVGRLKNVLTKSLEMPDIKNDSRMLEKTTKVLHLIESYYKSEITQEVLLEILKIQSLAQEIEYDGD